MTERPPVRLAVVDDYDVVLVGVAHMFDQYQERIRVVELRIGHSVDVDVDVVLYDTFAQGEADAENLRVLVGNTHAARVVVFTWNLQAELVDEALARGAAGYLSKTLTAAQLVDALERIHGGEVVVSPSVPVRNTVGLDWPGRNEGLTARESEILALITQGKSNAEIAALSYLSINSVKTHIRNAYRKAGVTTRTQAVLWGIDHGFRVGHRAIDDWR